MQLLAEFKKILYMEFTATLNFRKFKLAREVCNHSICVESGLVEETPDP